MSKPTHSHPTPHTPHPIHPPTPHPTPAHPPTHPQHAPESWGKRKRWNDHLLVTIKKEKIERRASDLAMGLNANDYDLNMEMLRTSRRGSTGGVGGGGERGEKCVVM